MTKHWTVLVAASLATLLALLEPAQVVRADIFQWEYINPANPSQGKQQSTTLVPDGAGTNAVRGTDLSNRDLTKAYLTSADVSAFRVIDEGILLYSINSDLTAVNLSQAELTNVTFGFAKLAGANFTGAEIRGARFGQHFSIPGSGLTIAQLYSTASYAAHDLSAIHLHGNLVGANFAMQNLTGASLGPDLTDANFGQANLRDADLYGPLTGANLSGAEVREANFNRYGYPLGGLTLAQLYSTASYRARDLSGIDLSFNDLTGGNFAGQNLVGAGLMGSVLVHADFSHANLSGVAFTSFYSHPEFPEFYAADMTHANLSHANLTNAIIWSVPTTNTGVNLTGADARGAEGFDPIPASANVGNFIRPDGRLAGLSLTAGASLEVRDYDGNPAAYPTPTGPLPIVVDDHLTMDAAGALRLVFDADPWDSTIAFASGIPVTLGGTLELDFAPGVNAASQIGRTLDLFDWEGVSPTGVFAVESPYVWDLANLYATGEVKLLAVSTLPGDFDGDGVVDGSDFLAWQRNPSLGDLADWKANFGAGSSAATNLAVPEPSAAALLSVAGLLAGGVHVSSRSRFRGHLTPPIVG